MSVRRSVKHQRVYGFIGVGRCIFVFAFPPLRPRVQLHLDYGHTLSGYIVVAVFIAVHDNAQVGRVGIVRAVVSVLEQS